MTPSLQAAVHNWQSFYTLLGGASATLTGLLFVTVSLGIRLITPETMHRVHIFMTPAVVHFSAVLLVAEVMTMPQASPFWLAVELGTLAAAGLVYMTPVVFGMKRIHREADIAPSNLIWTTFMPTVAYAGVGASAALIGVHSAAGLRVLAAAAIVLLLATVRNVWMMTVFLASKQ